MESAFCSSLSFSPFRRRLLLPSCKSCPAFKPRWSTSALSLSQHDKRHNDDQIYNSGISPTTFDPATNIPQIHRSKMILTRRVYSWMLRKRRTAPPKPQADFMHIIAGQSQLSKRGKLTSRLPPFEAALWLREPVPTFVFQRGVVSFTSARRAGDPPYRYLELRYGLVEPFCARVGVCSNPRVKGRLKQWYETARRWNVLHGDFRQPLKLRQEKRVGGKGGVSVRKLADGRRLERKRVVLTPGMVEGRWERALGRAPRVIVVGDVHGCIDELQALLRLADFQPGDQVVLLGDLVAKGPDSVGVVRMAREIGARTVRGNHDFEVVRWWEARLRGDEQAMVSMEHAKIAESLGTEELTWLVEAPWFIESEELGYLFVHAGFIPGVKLTQQNPRLMMNMRSVLSDGTVTAKNVEDCEWGKLWRGPRTVVFGHDAFRGLQQYEYAMGIDTGCVYGGRLTALLLPENRLVSVAAKRSYISIPRKYRKSL